MVGTAKYRQRSVVRGLGIAAADERGGRPPGQIIEG
jgi:hypothetical protein